MQLCLKNKLTLDLTLAALSYYPFFQGFTIRAGKAWIICFKQNTCGSHFDLQHFELMIYVSTKVHVGLIVLILRSTHPLLCISTSQTTTEVTQWVYVTHSNRDIFRENILAPNCETKVRLCR